MYEVYNLYRVSRNEIIFRLFIYRTSKPRPAVGASLNDNSRLWGVRYNLEDEFHCLVRIYVVKED